MYFAQSVGMRWLYSMQWWQHNKTLGVRAANKYYSWIVMFKQRRVVKTQHLQKSSECYSVTTWRYYYTAPGLQTWLPCRGSKVNNPHAKGFYKTHTVCVCVQPMISVEGEIILPSIPLHISHSAVSCSSRAKKGSCDFYSVVILLSVCSPASNSCVHPLSLSPSLLFLLLFTKV